MSHPSAAQIEQAAHRILAQSAFRNHGPSGLQGFLDRITGAIERFFAHILDWFTGLFSGASGHGGIGDVLSILVVVIVLCVIAVLVRHIIRSRVPKVKVPALTPGELPTDADTWLARAREAERAGDFAEAMRCHYRASVTTLAARGHIAEVPGGTAGEYRAQVVRTAPGLYDNFAALTDAFECVWYAGVVAGPADGQQSRELCDAVVSGASR